MVNCVFVSVDTKFNLPTPSPPSTYVTSIFVSVLPVTIPPTISWTASVVNCVFVSVDTKFNLPTPSPPSTYVTSIFVSVLPVTIPPTISWTASVVNKVGLLFIKDIDPSSISV